METNENVVGDNMPQDLGENGGEKKGSVSHETYSRTLDEIKAERRKRKELENQFGEMKSRLEQAELEKAKESENWEGVAKQLEEKLKTQEQKNKLAAETIYNRELNATYRNQLSKMGCVDVDDALGLLKAGGVMQSTQSAEVDGIDVRFDLGEVEKNIEDYRQQSSLFRKSFDVKTVNVNHGVPSMLKNKDVSEMSKDELINAILNN